MLCTVDSCYVVSEASDTLNYYSHLCGHLVSAVNNLSSLIVMWNGDVCYFYFIVINNSVVLFVGEPIVVGKDVRVTIDCSPVIDPVIASGIPNPTITWTKDGVELTGNGSAPNVEISADRRRLIITDTLLTAGGQFGNDGNYTCQVCNDSTNVNCRNRTTCIAVCGE